MQLFLRSELAGRTAKGHILNNGQKAMSQRVCYLESLL